MLNELFIVIIFLALMLIFRWAFNTLPDERWQIIGCLPYRQLTDSRWQGWNLTWYGFFNAVAIVFAVCMFLIMTGSLSIPLIAGLSLLTLLLAICFPAARMIAFLIEKKSNTSTVGGASFIGIIAAPWIILLTNVTAGKWLGFNITPRNALAAMSIAYTLGEGIGRLACISFGCCYGKPLADCSPLINKIFQKHNFIFSGKTKKISYAHKLDGQRVIPIQAITAVIYSLTGLAGCYLFLKGFMTVAFVLTLIVTQLWRVFSEFLRADYRGEGKISAYQMMALIACLYGLLIAYISYQPRLHAPDLLLGLSALWNPVVLIFLMALWIVTFFYMGKSRVTASLINIYVQEKKI
ncbi:MAG: prolipoprotein diacylglyceryl transferase [Deltaproteobacteria bacterium]|nr:prolipoprotein diacylglyceryl transferase [Deltaproteobacteria bacterium]